MTVSLHIEISHPFVLRVATSRAYSSFKWVLPYLARCKLMKCEKLGQARLALQWQSKTVMQGGRAVVTCMPPRSDIEKVPVCRESSRSRQAPLWPTERKRLSQHTLPEPQSLFKPLGRLPGSGDVIPVPSALEGPWKGPAVVLRCGLIVCVPNGTSFPV